MNDIDKLQEKIDKVYNVLKSLTDTREDFGKRLNELENNNMAAGDHSHQIKALHDQLQRLLLRDNKVEELQGSCKLFFDRVINLEHIGATNDNLSKAALRKTKKIQDKINAMKQKTKNAIDDIVSRQKKVNEIVFERLGYLDNEVCKVEPQDPLLKKVGDTIKNDNGDEHTIVKVVTEEEIRPQIGEVWETAGGDLYSIGYPHSGKIFGSEIGEDDYSREWNIKGNYLTDRSHPLDLIKKISDAPKPESKVVQPGEIWKDARGMFNLVLNIVGCVDYFSLVVVDTDGNFSSANPNGRSEVSHKYNLVEKTDLIFSDFLKLNKGE